MKEEIVPISITFCILSLLIFFSGCLGEHNTCPHCDGTGRNPETLGVTSCPKCGGDGKVGLFLNDEGSEDLLSFLVVGILLIVVIVEICLYASKQSREATLQPQTIIMQPPVHSQPTEKRFCVSCGRFILFDTQICPYCRHDYRQPVREQPQPRTCPSCGREVKADWAICGYCGRKLEGKVG
ncbi:MAG: zinc ribbon domain-containing protein [Candidatus Thermoplasmatota archaeon]